MGCDIHAFVEYKQKNSSNWWNFGDEFRLDRDYTLFTKLAGVRSGEGELPLFEPRGLPDEDSLGWATKSNAFYLVLQDDEVEEEGCVSLQQAEEWLKMGVSKRVGNDYITHPDWHTHSWLFPAEFEIVLQDMSNLKHKVDTGYWALLEAMKVFEADGYKVRLVFWFDN